MNHHKKVATEIALAWLERLLDTFGVPLCTAADAFSLLNDLPRPIGKVRKDGSRIFRVGSIRKISIGTDQIPDLVDLLVGDPTEEHIRALVCAQTVHENGRVYTIVDELLVYPVKHGIPKVFFGVGSWVEGFEPDGDAPTMEEHNNHRRNMFMMFW